MNEIPDIPFPNFEDLYLIISKNNDKYIVKIKGNYFNPLTSEIVCRLLKEETVDNESEIVDLLFFMNDSSREIYRKDQ